MGETVHINLLGMRFSIQTDEDTEYVQSLIDYLAEKIQEIESSTGSQDKLRTSILTALLLADELNKTRQSAKETDSETSVSAEAITRRLIEQIDNELE